MKHYLVYQITNLINGMIYIGKHVTDDPNDSYMGSSKWLTKSIKKHGIEHYRKDILFDFDNEAEMNAKEHELVNDVFVERTDTYNLNVGGTGSWYACNSNGMNNKNEQYRIAGDKCRSDPQYREQFGAKVSAGMKHYYENNPGIMSGERNPMFNHKHSKATRDKLSKTIVENLIIGMVRIGTLMPILGRVNCFCVKHHIHGLEDAISFAENLRIYV